MKKATIFAILMFLLFSIPAIAQQWTTQQKEVWKTLEDQIKAFASGDMEANYKFIHPDFVFWNDWNSVPGDYETAKKLDSAWFKLGAKTYAFTLTPLTILINGDFAVLNFYLRGFRQEPGATEVKFVGLRLHNLWKKEGGKWLLLANFIYEEK